MQDQESALVWKLICLYRQLAPTYQIVRVLRQLGDGCVSIESQELLLANCVLPADGGRGNYKNPTYEGYPFPPSSPPLPFLNSANGT